MSAWIVLITAIFFAVTYFKLFKNLSNIWVFKTQQPQIPATEFQQPISIIVAFRNEAENLPVLLKSFSNLSYPISLIQFIFIDDHSSDKGPQIIHDFMTEYGGNYEVMINPANGKKAAVFAGAQAATAGILLFTDADVSVPSNWIQHMLLPLGESIDMVCGPVMFQSTDTFFSKWMQLEFIGLLSSGASFVAAQRPVLANGANLLVRKNAYYNAHVQMAGREFSSGDDVFLLHALHDQSPGSITFSFSQEAVVQTPSPSGLAEFVHQRLRWAGKVKGYKNKQSLFLSLYIFAYHFFLVLGLALSFKWFIFMPVWLIMLLVKMITDQQYFSKILPFFTRKTTDYGMFRAILLHTFYIVVMGVLSLFLKASWKGRKL